jgi:capsular polysaccharide biosynthesis protein
MAVFRLLSLEEHGRDIENSASGGSYTELATAVPSAPQAPAFLVGPMPDAVGRRFYQQTNAGPVRCYRFRQATLAAHGIITHQGLTLYSEALNHPEDFVKDFAARIFDETRSLEVRCIDEQAVLLNGPGAVVFGHWLVDFLPRLFVLAESGFDLRKLKYIVSNIPHWVYPVLGACGLTFEQLVLHREHEEFLQVAELIVPTNVRQRSRVHSLFKAVALDLQARVNLTLPIPPSPVASPHLFVSRSEGNSSRSLENRIEIEDLAARSGLTIVRPETFSFAEQIALFSNARIIVGEYGSALHLSMFSQPGAVVCALRGSSHHPAWIQSGIGQVMGQPTGYLLGNTPEEAVSQSIEVSAQSFELGLELSHLLADKS